MTSDGVHLAVTDEGSGEPVLLCHALASSSADLERLAEALLERGRRVVRFDQRGHGRSGGPGQVTVHRLARDVEEVVVGLELWDVVVVGHSSGGFALLAVDRAVARDRIRKIVCVGTTSQITSPSERFMMRYAGSRRAGRLQSTRRLGKALVRFGAFGRAAEPALVAQVWETAAACGSQTRSAFASAILAQPDLTDAARDLGVPIVAIRGSRDRVVTKGRVVALANSNPRGSSVEIRDAGHMLVIERPAEVADAITGGN